MAGIALSNYKADSPGLGVAMYGLGQLYENLGEYAKALSAYETAYTWGKDHYSPELVHSAIAMARVAYLEGDYDVAWSKAKFAEDLCQQTWGSEYYRTNSIGSSGLEILTAIEGPEAILR